MELTFLPITLKLSEVFTIAHDQRSEQEAIIVGLRWGDYLGIGQSTASKYYDVSIEQMIRGLEAVKPFLEGMEAGYLLSPEEFWENVYPYFKDNHFALSALDMAYHDLYGKVQDHTLHELWGLRPEEAPLTNYTIGIASIPEMKEKIQATPWPLYKIKLGTEHDLDIIQALREVTDAPFRVDANCAWTAGFCKDIAPKLQSLGVEFIEQPLKAEDWEGMKEIYPDSPLPYLADESCKSEADVERCQGHFHGINIKLPKCGGLTPAIRMIRKAKALNMQVMVGCMTESIIGISAISQLAPLLDYIDVDGAMTVSNDVAEGIKLEKGKILFSDLPGIGVSLHPDFQNQLLGS